MTFTSTTTRTEPVLRLRAESPNPRTRRFTPRTFESKEEERQYVKERLAGAFRIFAKLGYDELVAGHITVRDPIDPHTFWLNPFGVSFELMTVEDLLRIDHDGNVIEGGKPGTGQIYNAAGFAIHGAIHKHRPDINAAAHSHSPYGRAFSVLGRNVDLASYDGAVFAETVKLYNDFGGVVLDDQEGLNICGALGPKGKGIVLRNHGLLSAASSVDAAVAYFVRLEKLCEVQLKSDIAGEPLTLEDRDVTAVFSEYGGEDEACFQAEELYEWIDHESGDYK